MSDSKKKQEVGLPSSFGISVPMDSSKPVDLGGYLDEVFETPQPASKVPAVEKEPPTPPREKPRRIEPPRKQVNMKPETMRKIEELLKIVRNRGPQRTAAMSEVFDALISVLYEVRDSIDFAGVPKRGQWGSATASAYVSALGKSFSKAITERHQGKH